MGIKKKLVEYFFYMKTLLKLSMRSLDTHMSKNGVDKKNPRKTLLKPTVRSNASHLQGR